MRYLHGDGGGGGRPVPILCGERNSGALIYSRVGSAEPAGGVRIRLSPICDLRAALATFAVWTQIVRPITAMCARRVVPGP